MNVRRSPRLRLQSSLPVNPASQASVWQRRSADWIAVVNPGMLSSRLSDPAPARRARRDFSAPRRVLLDASYSTTVTLIILTGVVGRSPELVGVLPILFTTS